MDFALAKRRILSLYEQGQVAYSKVSKEEFRQLYFSIHQNKIKNDPRWNQAVGEFLLRGTISYDRFIGLRPHHITEELYETFCLFLNALQKHDGDFMGRTAFLHLHIIKWDIFRECNFTAINDTVNCFLEKCIDDANSIDIPTVDIRIANNIERKRKSILGLIDDIRNGNIETVIHTSLPYKLTEQNATIHLVMNDINIDIIARNVSQGSSLPMVNIAEGSTMETFGPSKWTTTTTELDIVCHCLIDADNEVPRVTIHRKENEEFHWSTIFDITYRIILTVWEHFQQQEDAVSLWAPLPNDIHYINYKVCAGEHEYDKMYTTNPALVYRVSSLNKPSKNYTVSTSNKPHWSSSAFLMARLYAECGQLEESIFWLNVSTEALVEEYIQGIATTEELKSEIEGVERKFDTAEEILSEQFPEMKGLVKWPDTVIHTSVFTKLKRAIRNNQSPQNQKDIIKKYSLIQSKRNSLFHGRNETIEITDVEKAFNAYDWLKQHLV